MEEPRIDIRRVILELTTTSLPEVQAQAVERYMTRDVSFLHPVCWVRSGPNSRDTLLKVYQWYRILSPKVEVNINNIVYDSQRETLYLDLTQSFKLFFIPFSPAPARLLTWLQLRKIDNLYYISEQEDFYHTLSFTALLVPGLLPIVTLWLTFAAFFSYWAAMVGQQLGFWVPKGTRHREGGEHDDLYELKEM
ncbi:hypothetical protein BKA70DRAFT_1567719 [Coprinopsis sp. MPI-PUGE-AT-0042]|nr:hypothetical protein BKA70DRAFT_1567719 [Coprinopsis sp. MPI-PUGE-AT-0042]